MEWGQIRVVLIALWHGIVNMWYVIFSVLGVVIFGSSYFINDVFYSNLVLGIGTLIVATGGFSAMTRWLSVHGIVKKEMQNILFGDEYLRTDQGFDVVWNKLVSASVSQHMPILSMHLNKGFLRDYLPSKNELFYKRFHQTLDVYWHDKPQRIIKVKERCVITVQCVNATLHKLRYSFNADFPDTLPLTYTVTDLKLNNVDKLALIHENPSISNQTKTHSISYELDLIGSEEYDCFRSMERLISLDYEPFVQVK